jgi:DNA-directed RNA polymerase
MDASTITLLIKKMREIGFKNIYTIHDCFASTACNIPVLHELVKESFISLYANNTFVHSLHKLFIEYINGNYDIKRVYKIDNEEKYEIIGKGSID